jgi:serine/threonine protein kinase HipA of HipAB toxin-antitoxin module
VEQQLRRAVLNIVARNQDDHVKNIAFLMDRSGQWSLSPAFDVAYAYNPSGDWTARHQGARIEYSHRSPPAGARASIASPSSPAPVGLS